ncbi:MAG: glycoside hydrolase family 3 C-terminal domain-containing protein [Chloroflexi bacterium]|nr:glycoside hydrolase family 3 C-terminal domain-containing protein [Chloroflexota bacterium]
MKHRALILLVILLLSIIPIHLMQTAAQEPLAPDGEPGQTYFAPFPVPITLDGDLADWGGVPRVLLSAEGDPEIRFAAAADETTLYLMGDITDSTIISGQHNQDYWNEDSVEFYLNATGDFTLSTYLPGVAQITVPALNRDLTSEEAVLAGVQGTTANAKVAALPAEKGWTLEIAIPLKNDVWDITLAHGTAIGFQVHLNGASESNRDTKLIWSVFDKSDLSYQNPSLFGFLILYEIGQTEIPALPGAGTEEATPVPTVAPSALYKNPDMPTEARVMDLMSRMSLEEKIGQMTLVEKNSIRVDDIQGQFIGGLLSGGGGYPSENTAAAWAEMVDGYQELALGSHLGIPLIYGVDAVHGHNNLYGATVFPHNIGLGAAGDPELVKEACRITAQEMIATGIYWDYSPVLAVVQDIRWGRTYESFSENTELVTALSTACVQGLQGEALNAPGSVLASIKHFVGDGGTAWGSSTTEAYMLDQGVTDVDEETLRATHLAPYLSAVDAGAQNVMVSFSSWGGMKMHAQQYLITEVLKGELGFEGFVVSDWAGVDQIAPQDYYASVVTSINAGMDMVMVPYNYPLFIDAVKRAVNDGDIPTERIDDAVKRILTVKFNMGLFEHPYSDAALLEQVGSAEHRAVAREAVAQTQVLLKNERNTLPIDPSEPLIFVTGAAADNIGMQAGGWTIEWQGVVGNKLPGASILDGIRAAVSSSTRVEYDASGQFADFVDGSGKPYKAAIGIAVVGELPYAEGRGDSLNPALYPEELASIEALRARCHKLVVVVVSGRPLIVADQIGSWDALVAAWLPGSEGQGVADALFGYRPYTGKTAFSWPASADQLPLAAMTEPLFPFGAGLETTATQDTLPALVTNDPKAAEPVAETPATDAPAAAAPVVVGDIAPLSQFDMDVLPEVVQDEYANNLGYVAWGDTAGNVTLATAAAEGDLAVPEQADGNRILAVSYDIASWGGFSGIPTDGTNWTPGDFSAFAGIQFWLYGNTTGGTVQFELFDNRAAGSTGDTAERWFFRITDDYAGWKLITIPFSDFQRRTDWQPTGAPDDGLGLTEVSGYAFGFPGGVGAQTAYIDEVALFMAAE